MASLSVGTPAHPAAQLTASGVCFAYGPRTVLDDVSLILAPGDRIGVIGPNGTGKSTLLRILASRLEPTAGSVALAPPEARVGLLSQVLDDRAGESVRDYTGRRTGIAAVIAEFDAAIAAVAEDGDGAADRYDRALARFVDLDAAGFDERLAQTLDEVGLEPELIGRPCNELSGGQRSRVGLATMALSTFDIVLLDEPTNDLDPRGLDVLETFVTTSAAAMAIVSHDRAFLSTVATSILELSDHDHAATRFNGGFDAWLIERERARRRHQEAYDEFQSKRSALADRAQQQRQWSDRGANRVRVSDETDKFIRARRRATSEKQAAKAKQAQRAMERLERDHSVEAPWKPWELQLRFGESERAGSEVAVLSRAIIDRGSFRFGPVDATVESGDRLLITGPNGSGKTTLINALLGRIELTSGSSHLGPSVRPGILGQNRTLFAGSASLLRAFTELARCDDQQARSQLAKLGLPTERLDRPTDELSMGEHTRAALGLFAMVGTNLLVIDEPTNHLDLPAIEALEAALARYPHTLIVVSHDRRFVEALETNRCWFLAATEAGDRTTSLVVEH